MRKSSIGIAWQRRGLFSLNNNYYDPETGEITNENGLTHICFWEILLNNQSQNDRLITLSWANVLNILNKDIYAGYGPV